MVHLLTVELHLGLDRLIMLLTKTGSIRDIIAFPKTQSAACLLTDAPGEVNNEQLVDLNIKVIRNCLLYTSDAADE